MTKNAVSLNHTAIFNTFGLGSKPVITTYITNKRIKFTCADLEIFNQVMIVWYSYVHQEGVFTESGHQSLLPFGSVELLFDALLASLFRPNFNLLSFSKDYLNPLCFFLLGLQKEMKLSTFRRWGRKRIVNRFSLKARNKII